MKKKIKSSPDKHYEGPSKKHKDEKPARDHSKSKGEVINNGVHTSQLMELFEEQLKDILWAEKALVKAIPKMIKKATSQELIDALQSHLSETENQISNVEQVFESIDKKANAKKCEAMQGLIKEASEMMEDCEKGPKCDAGIIFAAQKIEHYEIATYGTLRKFAETLGLREAEMLLMETLNEEKAVDQKLTEVAIRGVNTKAASEQMQELTK